MYQKLNKERPDKVYDFDTYEQFRSNRSLSTNPKKRSISGINTDEEEEEEEEEYSDDNSDQEAGSSISSMNKRVRN